MGLFEDHADGTANTPVVILCGGLGTRLGDQTKRVPKPMVTIGGHPLLWHIIGHYRAYGFRRFIICLGYLGNVIREYFDENAGTAGIEVQCVDTGPEAMTGARVKRIQHLVETDTFMLTYGDGLSDVNLRALLEFHRSEGTHVTVTGVHPPARFGSLHLAGKRVTRFSEKAQTEQDYINGGFLVCNSSLFGYLEDNDSCVLERTPLERLAADGELSAYLHHGFWQCMDTTRDREVLESMWTERHAWGNQ